MRKITKYTKKGRGESLFFPQPQTLMLINSGNILVFRYQYINRLLI